MAERKAFGELANGSPVHCVTLTGGGLTANVLTWGAVLQDLRLEGHKEPLVCGFEEFAHYPKYSPYFGSTPGRLSNRIGNASLELDGKTHNTDANYLGKHTLHGGSQSSSTAIWDIADLGTSHVDLTLTSPNDHMGFPGECEHICSITLKDNSKLHIAYTSRSSAKTVAGLTHHSYWRLDSEPDCLATEMQVFADHYLPVDDEMIPTGEIASVANTPFDFREMKMIESDLSEDFFYDHNFCLAHERRNIQEVAKAHSTQSGITMAVATTEPGLQFYTAHKLDVPVKGLSKQNYGPFAGFCLEAQNWPDAPNNSDFPTAVLNADEELRQVTEYQFSKD